jgi:rhomboid protease GluP
MGSTGVLAVYILTGAAGNLLSTFVNWWKYNPELMELAKSYHGSVPIDQIVGRFPPGAGASGAVFGIAGALIILLNSHRLPVPRPELQRLRKSVIYFAALNLAIPFFFNFGASAMHAGVRIDNMAHLGGFSCGLLFAAPMVPRIGAPRDLFLFRLRVTTVMVVGILVLFGVFLTKFAG